MNLSKRDFSHPFICGVLFNYSGEIVPASDTEVFQSFYDSDFVDADFVSIYNTKSKTSYKEKGKTSRSGMEYTQTLTLRIPIGDSQRSLRIEKLTMVKNVAIELTNGAIIVMGRNDFYQNTAPIIETEASENQLSLKIASKSMFSSGYSALSGITQMPGVDDEPGTGIPDPGSGNTLAALWEALQNHIANDEAHNIINILVNYVTQQDLVNAMQQVGTPNLNTVALQGAFTSIPIGGTEVFTEKTSKMFAQMYDIQNNLPEKKEYTYTEGDSQKFQLPVPMTVLLSITSNGVELSDSQYNENSDTEIEVLDELDNNDFIIIKYYKK